jgi:choline-sulfatase
MVKKHPVSVSQTPPDRPRRRFRNAVIAVALTGFLVAGVWTLHRLGRLDGLLGKPKLNLLLITLDTTRADHLGCYGGTAASTPNLDQLAQAGVRCAQCTTACPLTLPAHASIMTGVSPFVHGARFNGTTSVPAGNRTIAKTLLAAGYRTRAAVASFVLNRHFGLDQGFEVFHDVVPPVAGAPLEAERRADVVCDDAVNLLESVSGDRFFLWVHFYDPHVPYLSTRHPDRNSPEAYADEVSFMDQHIGRLLQELRRLKLDSSTLVVAVGDHGEGLGQHEELTHGYFLYDTTLHVPLIFRCPGVLDAGRVVESQVRTIDIAPTILALLGCPEMPDIQGTSVVPLLRGQELPVKLPAYAETLEASHVFGLSFLRSMQLAGWKYILAPEPELFNLASDPAESGNQASAQTERAAQLRRELRAFVAESPPPVRSNPQEGLPVEDVQRLRSLGYVGGPATAPADLQAELSTFEPRGGNPRSYVKAIQLFDQAREATKLGRFPAAEQMLREVIQILPSAAEPYAALAAALRGERRMEEAVGAAQEAVARAQDNTYLRSVYGSLLLDAGRPEEAAAQFRIVLSTVPRDMIIHHNMAVALMSLGRVEEAEQHLQIGLSIQPDNPVILRSMGVLRGRQGRIGEAVSYLRKALAIDPNFQQAAQDLRTLGGSPRQ